MEKRFHYGTIKKLSEASSTLEIEGKDYVVQRGPVMLPPTIKIGDNIRAIIVKGEIRHVELDKTKQTNTNPVQVPAKPPVIQKIVKLNFVCYASSKDESHKQKVFVLK